MAMQSSLDVCTFKAVQVLALHIHTTRDDLSNALPLLQNTLHPCYLQCIACSHPSTNAAMNYDFSAQWQLQSLAKMWCCITKIRTRCRLTSRCQELSEHSCCCHENLLNITEKLQPL